jgi:hypothetical protein
MGPSEKTFNQVKNILGKLDRSIDQLRQKRTAPPAPLHPSAESMRTIPISQPQPPARPSSQFGRATPLPPA